MTPSRLRYEVMQERYQSQRDRREAIRGSVATPVAALAFSAFNLGQVALRLDAGSIGHAVNLVIFVLMCLSVLSLLVGAGLIVRVEKNVVYVDPPDLEELVESERRLRDDNEADEHTVQRELLDAMAGAYDIVYRHTFAANEQAARDRTRGLHLILLGLALIIAGYLLLPFQTVGVT